MYMLITCWELSVRILRRRKRVLMMCFPRSELFQCCLQSWHLVRQHLQVLPQVCRSQKQSHSVRYLYRHRNQLRYKPQCSRTRPRIVSLHSRQLQRSRLRPPLQQESQLVSFIRQTRFQHLSWILRLEHKVPICQLQEICQIGLTADIQSGREKHLLS